MLRSFHLLLDVLLVHIFHMRHGLVEFLKTSILTFSKVWLPNVTSTSANPRMPLTSLPSAVTSLILDLSYGLISMFRIFATSSLITEIAAPVSGIYCIAMLFSNQGLSLSPLFGISKALNVIVLYFCGDFMFVGVTKLKNLMILDCPELISGGLGVGISISEYPCGVIYSVLFIKYCIAIEEFLIDLSNIYCF